MRRRSRALIHKTKGDHSEGTWLGVRDKERVLVDKVARGGFARRLGTIKLHGQVASRDAKYAGEIVNLLLFGREKCLFWAGQYEIEPHQFVLNGEGLPMASIPVVCLAEKGVEGSSVQMVNMRVVGIRGGRCVLTNEHLFNESGHCSSVLLSKKTAELPPQEIPTMQ